jgi:hypothetical protein
VGGLGGAAGVTASVEGGGGREIEARSGRPGRPVRVPGSGLECDVKTGSKSLLKRDLVDRSWSSGPDVDLAETIGVLQIAARATIAKDFLRKNLNATSN